MNIIDTSKIVDNAYVMYGNGGLGLMQTTMLLALIRFHLLQFIKRRVIFLSNLRFMTKKWLIYLVKPYQMMTLLSTTPANAKI
ncbi:hypothetical protein IDM32_04985 [Acinetobacter seifertii]|nr:hypothetical protein [Acinetobacter seifertii]